MKFCAEVLCPFKLYIFIDADSEEEAISKAKKAEVDDFANFHDFYEWLGNEWSNLIENIKVKKL